MATGWKKLDKSNDWVYYDDKGNRVEGQWIKWKKDSKTPERWYFLNYYDGTMARGWLWQNGYWYFLDDSGAMATNWRLIGGFWYHFSASGHLEGGWKKISRTDPDTKKVISKWYYLDPITNQMKTGWLDVVPNDNTNQKERYFLDSNGAMVTKWAYIDDYWYYFGTNGRMATGWIQVPPNDDSKEKYWYYLDADGRMATDNVTINGVTYVIASNGRYLYKL